MNDFLKKHEASIRRRPSPPEEEFAALFDAVLLLPGPAFWFHACQSEHLAAFFYSSLRERSRLACQTTDNQRCLVPAGGKRLCFHRGLRKSAGRRRPFSDIAMGEDSACLCSSCQSFVQDDTQGDGILLGH